MRLLRGIGTGILAVGIALAAAGAASAQNGQQNGQPQDGSSGTAPPQNNVPYKPPTIPTGDATGSGYGNGRPPGGVGTGQSGSSNGGVGRLGVNNSLAEDTPETQQQIELRQAMARNAERQKQLIADTQKLVALANQLQVEVNDSTKDMLSLDVVRKADEIDKLARTVRDRMKNAN